MWGYVVERTSIQIALIASGIVLIGFSVVGRRFRSADDIADPTIASEDIAAPEGDLALTGRSGPIVIEIAHLAAAEDARDFCDTMLQICRIRRRNGANAWSLARDIANVRRWVERFHRPTWHDYLRHRTRLTVKELTAMQPVAQRYGAGSELRITRLPEPPVGSVSWRAETPDRGEMPIGMLP